MRYLLVLLVALAACNHDLEPLPHDERVFIGVPYSAVGDEAYVLMPLPTTDASCDATDPRDCGVCLEFTADGGVVSLAWWGGDPADAATSTTVDMGTWTETTADGATTLDFDVSCSIEMECPDDEEDPFTHWTVFAQRGTGVWGAGEQREFFVQYFDNFTLNEGCPLAGWPN